jgi:hypothetical protein
MPWYNFGVCAATRSPLRAAGGVRFTAPHPLRLLDRAGLCEGKQPGTHLFPLAQARQALTNACKRLGYPHFTQRSLRRMFITRAIEKGVDVIAEWQNHKDGGKLLLDTYSHVRPEHSNRMAQLMSDEAPRTWCQCTKRAKSPAPSPFGSVVRAYS